MSKISNEYIQIFVHIIFLIRIYSDLFVSKSIQMSHSVLVKVVTVFFVDLFILVIVLNLMIVVILMVVVNIMIVMNLLILKTNLILVILLILVTL